MMVKFVLLGSDALLFALIAVAAESLWWARRQDHLRHAMGRVAGSGVGTASAMVLVVFLAVAVLDSVHFRPRLGAPQEAYAVDVLSALDAALTPLRTHTEKTYSAPLATHSFAREMQEGGEWLYPRLKYGGAHLGENVGARDADVAQTALRGLALGIVFGGLAWLAALPLRRRHPRVAWMAAFTALLAMCVAAGPIAALAQGYHVFGTDKVGQDVLFLALKSIRTGVIIGTLTTLIMLPAAVLLGIVAGYVGGWVDDAIQYLYTTLNSIPGVLLIAAAVLMMQVIIDTHPEWFATSAERADARLLALCAILGVTSWTGLCRLLRGETLKLREMEYVQAARAFGVAQLAIMLRHILPNLMHIVLISLVMDFSGLVLAEAVLSYVGIGVDPNTISFGTMINAARLELAREPMVWWSLAAAFSFMFVLVLAANLFADVVRDAFDPRLG